MTAQAHDWLGTPIEIGSRVVYPAMSGRSAQMTEGIVVSFEVLTQDEYDALSKYSRKTWEPGRLTKVRVRPTGRSSRWRQHGVLESDPIKPVILTANARSVVVIPS